MFEMFSSNPFPPKLVYLDLFVAEETFTDAFVLLEVTYSYQSSAVRLPIFSRKADPETVAVVRLFSSTHYFSNAKSLVLLFPKGILQSFPPYTSSPVPPSFFRSLKRCYISESFNGADRCYPGMNFRSFSYSLSC